MFVVRRAGEKAGLDWSSRTVFEIAEGLCVGLWDVGLLKANLEAEGRVGKVEVRPNERKQHEERARSRGGQEAETSPWRQGRSETARRRSSSQDTGGTGPKRAMTKRRHRYTGQKTKKKKKKKKKKTKKTCSFSLFFAHARAHAPRARGLWRAAASCWSPQSSTCRWCHRRATASG
jgi:hypothetical protein